MPSILLNLSAFTSFNMRAIALLCLLHAAFGQFGWDGPTSTPRVTTGAATTMPPNREPSVCLLDQASCGCCQMQKQVARMEWFFNYTFEAMTEELKYAKMILHNMRTSRSAFSVALDVGQTINCIGPFRNDQLIFYNHVFLNLGDGYNMQTGIFTVPRTGVYSLSVTIYGNNTCANLQVNGQAVCKLLEQNGQDAEDSATIVKVMKLMAGDRVAVNLPSGCSICDKNSHYNTFTGFLLYAV